MAEWLRQCTPDLMEALRAGSNPGTGDFFYDDGGATQARAKRKRQRARMSAANVGASLKQRAECINFCAPVNIQKFKNLLGF